MVVAAVPMLVAPRLYPDTLIRKGLLSTLPLQHDRFTEPM